MTRPGAIALGAALSLASPDASAFEYNEHRSASREALRVALGGADGQALVRAAELLVTDRTGVPVCGVKSDKTRPVAQYACFELADVSGLAGDLSSRPGQMLTRFFTGQQFTITPQSTSFLVAGGAALRTLLPSSVDTPAVVPTAMAKTIDILSVTADPYFDPSQAANYQKNCESYFQSQFSLMERYGSQLTSLALANTSHFEISDLGPYSDIGHWRDGDISSHFESRSVHLNKLAFSTVMNANVDQVESRQSPISRYLELHGGAMMFEELASSAPAAKEAPIWHSLALIEELYALHYLQDLVAPGHRLTSARARGHTALARRYAHNCLNQFGETFGISALCDRLPLLQSSGLDMSALDMSALAPVCARPESSDRKVKLLGDAAATCRSSTDTFAVLKALSAISMLEVFPPETQEAPALSKEVQQARAVFAEVGAYDNGSLSDTSMSSAKTSLYWFGEKWDSFRANTTFAAQPKFTVLRDFLARGRFAALDLVPRRIDDNTVAMCEGEGTKSPMEICNVYLDQVLKRVSACDTESRTAKSRLAPEKPKP